MSRIGNARKLIKKAFDTAEKLNAANWNKWREQDFRGYQLAVMITSGTVTGVGPGAIECLEKLVESAEQLLVREQADIALAKGAEEDPLMKFLVQGPSRPVKYRAQFRSDAISAFGTVGIACARPQDAAHFLHTLMGLLNFPEADFPVLDQRMVDGETLEDEHGAAFRIVKV